ncbi:unnamed protein product, partial [marine sediment metagenome]
MLAESIIEEGPAFGLPTPTMIGQSITGVSSVFGLPAPTMIAEPVIAEPITRVSSVFGLPAPTMIAEPITEEGSVSGLPTPAMIAESITEEGPAFGLPTPANFAEIPAIRCRGCGKPPPISNYRELISLGLSREEAFIQLELVRNCCRQAVINLPKLPAGVTVDPYRPGAESGEPEIDGGDLGGKSQIMSLAPPPFE